MNNSKDPKHNTRILALTGMIADQKLEIDSLDSRVGHQLEIINKLSKERDNLQNELDRVNHVSGR